MQELEQFSELLNTIYEGATNTMAWPHIVKAVAKWLHADKGLLLTPFHVPESGGFTYPYGITQDNIMLWATHYQSADLWTIRLGERSLAHAGNVILGSELVTDQELRDSDWYREFLSRMDIFQLICGIVYSAGDAVLPTTACSFFRGAHAAPFDERSRWRLRLLMPHLSRALGVMFKLRDAEFRVAASLNALNCIHTGILLLDERGYVCFANASAEQILRREDGLLLKAAPRALGMLQASDARARLSLDKALRSAVQVDAQAVEHFAQATRVARPSGLADYAVQASYLPESNPYHLGTSFPRAIVFIRDLGEVVHADAVLLKETYGLTQAEVRAALALCDGGSMDSVAEQLGIQINTLKTHLKSIYSKVSVNNRAALTKLLLSLGSVRH